MTKQFHVRQGHRLTVRVMFCLYGHPTLKRGTYRAVNGYLPYLGHGQAMPQVWKKIVITGQRMHSFQQKITGIDDGCTTDQKYKIPFFFLFYQEISNQKQIPS